MASTKKNQVDIEQSTLLKWETNAVARMKMLFQRPYISKSSEGSMPPDFPSSPRLRRSWLASLNKSNLSYGTDLAIFLSKKRLKIGYLFDWEIRQRIWKTVLTNSSLASTRWINKNKTAVHENSFTNPFSDSPIERWKGDPRNPDLDFLIEIHSEAGFLGGEICFRISRSKAHQNSSIWSWIFRFPLHNSIQFTTAKKSLTKRMDGSNFPLDIFAK